MAKPVVLTVDDEPHILFILSQVLNSKGCEVLSADCGERALEVATKEIPDLIILDVMMPDISGFEVCKQLKANDATKDIPVVILTAEQNDEHKDAMLKLGVADYISKPFSPNGLSTKIDELLGNL
ncbi:PleD family two-component system response regulator [Thermodesulfobacteriota bacterium]